MKHTDIFDKLNNTIGNHMEGKATDEDLIKMAYKIDNYLLEHPHPHDLIKNNVGLSNVVGQSEQLLSFFEHIQREYNIEADVTFGEVLKSFEGK